MKPNCRILNLLLIISGVLALLSGPRALAESVQSKLSNSAQIFYSEREDERITELLLDRLDVEVTKSSDGGRFVHVTGSLAGNYYDLRLAGGEPIRLERVDSADGGKPHQRFEVDIPLSGRLTQIQLIAMDARGEYHKDKWKISYPGWDPGNAQRWAEIAQAREASSQTVAANAPEDDTPSDVDVLIAAGLTENIYDQTEVSQVQQLSLTVKGGVHDRLSENWDIGAGGYYTALPLSSAASAQALRFLGINLRAGYRLPRPSGKWSLKLSGGGYYTTTFTGANSAFGFSGMIGPQIHGLLSYALTGTSSLGAYFKFSPVFSGGQFSLSNNETAAGVTYSHKLMGFHNWLAMLDFAQLSFAQAPVTITSKSAGLSLGVDW